MKIIIDQENLCTKSNPGSTYQLSNILRITRAATCLTATLLAWTAFSLQALPEPGLKTCFAYTSISDGTASWKRAESFSHPTSLQRSGSWRHAFAVTKVPTNVPNCSSPTLQNMNIKPIVHFTYLRSVISSMFFPKQSINLLQNHYSGRSPVDLSIEFVYHKRLVYTFLWPFHPAWLNTSRHDVSNRQR